jgi:hypothetical protein
MEHLEDDGLNDDALSRLGVEGFVEDEPGETNIIRITDDTGVTFSDNVDISGVTFAANDNPWNTTLFVEDGIVRIDGDTVMLGDITVDGSINNGTISDMQTVLADAQSRILQLETDKILLEGDIITEQCERFNLEGRVTKLEKIIEESILTPKRD